MKKIVNIRGLDPKLGIEYLLTSTESKPLTLKGFREGSDVEEELTEVVVAPNPLEIETLQLYSGSKHYNDFFSPEGLNLYVDDSISKIQVEHSCSVCKRLYSTNIAAVFTIHTIDY